MGEGPLRIRDDVTVFNERLKLIAGFMNALAIGLVGFALIRPVVEDVAGLTLTTAWWVIVAFAFHGAAHYILGMIEKEF